METLQSHLIQLQPSQVVMPLQKQYIPDFLIGKKIKVNLNFHPIFSSNEVCLGVGKINLECLRNELCRLVDKINNSIGQDPTAKSIIGVLDIYGFESFKINR